jgi:nicotinamidase-related amidase
MPRTALLPIDIQNDLATNPQTRIPHATRLLSAGSTILTSARAHIAAGALTAGTESDLVIIHIQHEEPASSGALVRDTEPWQLALPALPTERVVGKSTASAFESNPELAGELRGQGVKELVVFGIQSDYCVGATSRGALDEGFGVTVLRGAHSTYDEGGKTAEEIEREIEKELEGKGAKVVDWEEWVKEL